MAQNEAEQAFAGMTQATTTPPPAAVPQDPYHRALRVVKKALPPVAHALQDFAMLPSEGINAVLGAPQRMEASDIANVRTNPRGVIGAKLLALADPAARKQLSNEAYAAFHPNDPMIEQGAEKAVGVDQLMSKDPRFRGKLQNFAVRTGFETLTDPLTFIGPGFAKSGESLLEGIGRAGDRALQSTDPVISKTASLLLTNPEERKAGLSARLPEMNVIRNKHIVKSRIEHTKDNELLAEHRDTLKQGIVPPAIRNRLAQLGKYPSVAGGGNLYDVVADAFHEGRQQAMHEAIAKDFFHKIGLSRDDAKKFAAPGGPNAGVEALRAVSKAQVDALMATGFPHMRNVGVMGYNAMGEPGMADAARMFATGVPQSLSQRLEEGAASHFGAITPGKYSPARLMPSKLRNVTTGALDRWDQAVRAARLKQLDKTEPSMSEVEKLDRVNQDIGAYNQRPRSVDILSGFGANFPQWHNYVVPTAVGRALLRSPQRVERLARYEQNANDSFLPNANYRFTLGGPNDEFAAASADPARVVSETGSQRYPKYFGGPSSIGPASLLFHPYGTFGQTLATTAANMIPFGNVGLAAATNFFKSPLKPLVRAGLETTGVYTQKRPPRSIGRTRTASTPPPESSGADPFAGIKL